MRPMLETVLARRRWRVADAEIVFSALSESGCTMSEFAQRHGLQLKRLHRWRERLSLLGPPVIRDDGPGTVPLVPVQVRGLDSLLSASGLSPTAVVRTLDVSVGRGVVHVPQDFDAEHLHRVVAVLVASC